MKKVLILIASMVLSQTVLATELTSLECYAANGVTLTTKEVTEDGLQILSSWGLLTKNFTAKLGFVSKEAESHVELFHPQGDLLYVMSLDLNPERSSKQLVSGHIMFPAVDLASEPTVITAVRCTLELSHED